MFWLNYVGESVDVVLFFVSQTAELLFFVIDNQTRSTASMVEAAYLAGKGFIVLNTKRKK